jgi:hypothetical protein
MQVNSTNNCPNCLAELSGPFCSECGQRQLDLDRPLGEIAGEVMEAFLSFDARILRTLAPLISRPGFLTREFLDGRRARYVHPFKLYFAFSVFLFLGISMSGYSVVRISGDDDVVVTAGGVASGEEVRQTVVEAEAEDSSFLGRVFQPLGELMEKDPDRLNRIFTDRLAKSIIILVPVFALLLRMIFWRRPYVAGLIFSLHTHSFAFFAILAGLALNLALGAAEGEGPGDELGTAAIAIYTFLALRRVYGNGRLVTLLKMFVLLLAYLVALILTMMLTLAATAMTV